jgi:hypothetical protein
VKREDFVARLATTGKAVEETMAQLLADDCLAGELSRPGRVLEAMRWRPRSCSAVTAPR